MRKIHRILRLFFEAGLSIRAIARSIQASPSTVGDYIRRAEVAGLSWPLPDKLDECALEARLFPGATVPVRVERAIPDWAQVHTERRAKNVTLALLWQEYKAEHPEGLQYSQFCERYRAWRQRLDVVMPPDPPRRREAVRRLRRDTPCLSSTPPRASNAKRKSSSPCSGRRATPLPKRPGPRRSRAGAPRTGGR